MTGVVYFLVIEKFHQFRIINPHSNKLFVFATLLILGKGSGYLLGFQAELLNLSFNHVALELGIGDGVHLSSHEVVVDKRQGEKGHQKVPKRKVEFTTAGIPFGWDTVE